jgi:hypothetical protein
MSALAPIDKGVKGRIRKRKQKGNKHRLLVTVLRLSVNADLVLVVARPPF